MSFIARLQANQAAFHLGLASKLKYLFFCVLVRGYKSYNLVLFWSIKVTNFTINLSLFGPN